MAGSLEVFEGFDLGALVAGMAAQLPGASGDPFAMRLAVTPGAAHQRHVSQTIARTNGFGVCAGIEFVTLPQLQRQLQQALCGGDLPHPDNDPWAAHHLSRLALQGFDTVVDEQWASPLITHLASDELRPGRRLATGRRVSRLARAYCRNAPDMIDAWDAGRHVGPDGQSLAIGDQWQPRFWQVLRDLAGVPHPLAQQRFLVDRVAGARPAVIPDEVHLLCVDVLHPQQVDLLAALAANSRVVVWQLNHASGADDAVLGRLSRVHATAMDAWRSAGATIQSVTPAIGRPATDLGRLQVAVHEGAEAVPRGGDEADGTIRLLPSHGPNRQVEVLRDYLCGLFVDDPTLEPRDVAVLCPDLDTFASVLDGALASDSPAADAHPGHQLRVRISHDGARQPNQVLQLLDDVLALRTSRATWQDLFDLCLSTPVAARWGFGDDGGQALKLLIGKANIRWGLDAAHRKEFGITPKRGTWYAGVEALVLGASYADAPLTTCGEAIPASHLDSRATELAGQLAEFVSRLRLFFHQHSSPATAAEWNDRLQGLISDLVAMPRQQRWQVAAARAALAEWAGPHADGALLGRADVRQVIAEMSRQQRMRPSFGTGALVVTGLRDLTGIPHRVVVLLGLDDVRFPRRLPMIGDDLLAGHPNRAVPNERARDQQHLLNALVAATERVAIVYQAQDASSLNVLDEPVPITELREAAGALGIHLPAAVTSANRQALLPGQAHSRANFLEDEAHGVEPFSFDVRAYSAIRHVEQTPRSRLATAAHGDLLLHDFPVAPHPTVVRLQDLTAFFKDPLRAFLQQRAGVQLKTWDDDLSVRDTLEATGLTTWQVKTTVLEHLRMGEDPESLHRHQLLSPDVPSTANGKRSVDTAMRKAVALADRLMTNTASERTVVVDIPVPHPDGDIRLVGAVRARGEAHLSVTTSKLGGHLLLEAWINALALSVATGRPPVAGIEDDKGLNELTSAPGHRTPAELLADLVLLYVHGQTHPLAAPPRTLWTHKTYGDDNATKDAWMRERDVNWEPFTPWDHRTLLEQTLTCSAADGGGCYRVPVRDLVPRLFGGFVIDRRQ
ncbi:exodeoxyribonuclease V subunit gamma [Propionibacteriaceae bacterium G1746]|uniref:exodeoxyribonuclease V subunit gamma n=1 Tax=Aestuariimicrobium sp. G57 TaxID=3418485 RepID=UPI003C16F2CB